MDDERLTGKRILIVEDEYFIAADLRRALVDRGATVIGPVSDPTAALALARDAIDAAVLDVNLNGTLSFPIADVLSDRMVPFVFLTGYDGWALPERYRATPRLAKPFQILALLACIERLVEVEERS